MSFDPWDAYGSDVKNPGYVDAVTDWADMERKRRKENGPHPGYEGHYRRLSAFGPTEGCPGCGQGHSEFEDCDEALS